uniref:NADH-ubiquinone oxidoreductase chain 4L n=1 Tax=Pharyngocirrus uchidai TaxID=2498818 RepID=A0A7G9IX18_9ANNE|nr:NADH dehydrogenase subunit 4L [Pharyngocirrus uchidai]QNM39912.1 NADH dehydrogenase subunit 4L [Pharyngocirrus uchidai]
MYELSLLLIVMPLLSISSLVLQQKHLLMALLALESAVLALVFISSLFLASPQHASLFIISLLLTFGACEASLGLALLVSMSRHYGSDLIKSITSIKC